MKLIFLDTETTGLGGYNRLCQLAYSVDKQIVNELFLPPVEMTAGAMATHKITPEMLKDKPAFKDSEHHSKLQKILLKKNHVMVAHNANFDVGMLRKEGITVKDVICTYKIAAKLQWEGKPKKLTLQTLREHFDIQLADAVAHDALGDIRVLEALFYKLYDIAYKSALSKTEAKGKKAPTETQILKRMIELSVAPATEVTKMPFGKYSGVYLAELVNSQRQYCEWICSERRKTGDVDDLVLTLEMLMKPKIEVSVND